MNIKYIEAFYLSPTENELNIVTDVDTVPSYDVYWTYNTDICTEEKMFIFSNDKKNVHFTFAYDTSRRQYFIIEFSTGESFLFGHRILPVDGMYNLRDIGGYLCNDGKRIRWGIGYRSDHLFNLEPSGVPYMESLGLKQIIDFRSRTEVESAPNYVYDASIQTRIFDPNAHVARLAGSLQSGSTTDNTEIQKRAIEALANNPHAGDDEMVQQQLTFVSSSEAQKAFADTLHALALPKNAQPSLQHCRGGKDRTGFALMLLEGLLGVSNDELIYDYMLTHRAREKKNAAYYQKFLDETGDPLIADYMFSLFDTKPAFIEASIHAIQGKYTTILNYVQNVLHLSHEEIEQLRTYFLE